MRHPETKTHTCDICGHHFTSVRDCTCGNGWHYEGGSIIGFERPYDNPHYGELDLLGRTDHTLSRHASRYACWDCQAKLWDLTDTGELCDLLSIDLDTLTEDDTRLDSESKDAWQKGWDECADHFEELLTQPNFLRTTNAVSALLEDQENEQKLYASITGDVPCPWCDGHLVTEYMQEEIYLVKCSNRCGRTTIVHACSPAEAVHTVTLPTPSQEVTR